MMFFQIILTKYLQDTLNGVYCHYQLETSNNQKEQHNMKIQQFSHHIDHMTCEYNTETKELSYTYAPAYGEPHTTVHTVEQADIDWMLERGQITRVKAPADDTGMVVSENVRTDNEALRSEIREVEQFVRDVLFDNDAADWYKDHDYILDKLSELPCFSDRVVKIYLDYVRPLYAQQDYMNNFLTVNGMAEYYDYPESVVRSLIDQGKHVRDNILCC